MPAHELDLALAKRIARGDEAAFRRLFDEYFPRLYRFALVRLNGDGEAARDIVQQTFCRAIEALDSYRGEAALYTWFCQICRHAVVDHLRTTAGRQLVFIEDSPQVQAILEALTDPDSGRGEHELRQRDVVRLVQTALDHLPDRYSSALEWKYIDRLSVAEIAQRLSVGPKAAESLLTRARESFREAMHEIADLSADLDVGR